MSDQRDPALLARGVARSSSSRSGRSLVNTVTRRDVVDALLIGYARVSTEEQDLTAQRDALAALGVGAERTYVDQGLTGTNRERPGSYSDTAGTHR